LELKKALTSLVSQFKPLNKKNMISEKKYKAKFSRGIYPPCSSVRQAYSTFLCKYNENQTRLVLNVARPVRLKQNNLII
jgi:hypothetical protein